MSRRRTAGDYTPFCRVQFQVKYRDLSVSPLWIFKDVCLYDYLGEKHLQNISAIIDSPLLFIDPRTAKNAISLFSTYYATQVDSIRFSRNMEIKNVIELHYPAGHKDTHSQYEIQFDSESALQTFVSTTGIREKTNTRKSTLTFPVSTRNSVNTTRQLREREESECNQISDAYKTALNNPEIDINQLEQNRELAGAVCQMFPIDFCEIEKKHLVNSRTSNISNTTLPPNTNGCHTKADLESLIETLSKSARKNSGQDRENFSAKTKKVTEIMVNRFYNRGHSSSRRRTTKRGGARIKKQSFHRRCKK